MNLESKRRLVVIFSIICLLIGLYWLNKKPHTIDEHRMACDRSTCVYVLDSASTYKIISDTLYNKINVHIFVDMSCRIDSDWDSLDNKLQGGYNSSFRPLEYDSAYILTISRSIQRYLNSVSTGLGKKVFVKIHFEPDDALDKEILSAAAFEIPSSNIEMICTLPKKLNNCCSKAFDKTIKKYGIKNGPFPDINSSQKHSSKYDHYKGSNVLYWIENKASELNDSVSRNLLFILTDGELVPSKNHSQINKRLVGNRTDYLTPEYLKNLKFNDLNWEANLNGGYGFIIPDKIKLQNVEVMVLGLKSYKDVYIEKAISKYWQNYFRDIGVKNFVDMHNPDNYIVKRSAETIGFCNDYNNAIFNFICNPVEYP